MAEQENIKLELRRIIPARREAVFKAWTDPSLMKQWWQQLDVKYAENIKLDLRNGGKYEIHMRTKTELYIMQGEYLEIVEPEKLVFTWRAESTYQKETKVTVLLQDLGAKTELLLTDEAFPDTKSRNGHFQGWSPVLDNLERLSFNL